jgi:NTE family protein
MSPSKGASRSEQGASRRHRPFTLVLSGGGARGFAHAGVLRVLEAYGFRPSALVGVSMGAVVAVTYSLREDWYTALLTADTSGFPGPLPPRRNRLSISERARVVYSYIRALRDMTLGWGVGTHALDEGERFLRSLTEDRDLEEGRVPVAVCATDLGSGERVIIRSGSAAQAIYASSALAGVLPPLERPGGRLLADGAYVDIAPIDVARAYRNPVVIAVDPGQLLEAAEIHNGLQALMRAFDICHRRHAELRFDEADLVLRPTFPRPIDTLDFDKRRECIAAGMRVARANRGRIEQLLLTTAAVPSGDGLARAAKSARADQRGGQAAGRGRQHARHGASRG